MLAFSVQFAAIRAFYGYRSVASREMPPRSIQSIAVPDLAEATEYLLALLYSYPFKPIVIAKNAPKPQRNAEIHELYANGWSIPKIAIKCGISNARVHQILRGLR